MRLFQTDEDRYRPAENAIHGSINQRTMALIVGLVAIGLPLILLFGTFNPVKGTCFRDSLSHYYYAQFWGSAFIGLLFFIGTYLLVYQGEDRDGAEGRLATFAGIAAYGVAVFPTTGHGCDNGEFAARALLNFGKDANETLVFLPHDAGAGLAPYFELTAWSGTLHYLSATILFGILFWFARYVFTAIDPGQRKPDGKLTKKKLARNAIYMTCAGLMLFAIAGLGIYAVLGVLLDPQQLQWWTDNNLTFWFEALALWAFGISWMVKGRFWQKMTPSKNHAKG